MSDYPEAEWEAWAPRVNPPISHAGLRQAFAAGHAARSPETCAKTGPTNLVHADVHASVVSERDALLQMRDHAQRQVDLLHSGINYLRGMYLGNAAEARRRAAHSWFFRGQWIDAAEVLESVAANLANALDRASR